MNCPHCGQPVAESATFCGSCGKPLVEGARGEDAEGYHARKEIAGIWIRLGSWLIDGIVIAIPNLFVAPYVRLGGIRIEGFPAWLPYAIVTYSLGASLGMRAAHLSMVNASGAKPGWGRGTGRALASVLSALPLGLGFFWAIWDPEHRTWHDHLAGTWVVRDE